MIVRWGLASTQILAGLALLSPVRSAEDVRALRDFGTLLTLAAAVQLTLYREASGAHSTPQVGEHQNEAVGGRST